MADRRDLAVRGDPVADQASRPEPAPRRPVRVLADDLTGAADSGVAFLGDGAEVVIALARPLAGPFAETWPPAGGPVTVVDTDTREASAEPTRGAWSTPCARPPRWRRRRAEPSLG